MIVFSTKHCLFLILLLLLFNTVAMRIITDEPINVNDQDDANLILVKLYSGPNGTGSELGCINQIKQTIYTTRQHPAIAQTKSLVIEKGAMGLEITFSDKSDSEKKAVVTIVKTITHPITIPDLNSNQDIADTVQLRCSPNGCPNEIDSIIFSTTPYIFLNKQNEL